MPQHTLEERRKPVRPKKKKAPKQPPLRKAPKSEVRSTRLKDAAASGNKNPGRFIKGIEKAATATGEVVGKAEKTIRKAFTPKETTTRSQARADAKRLVPAESTPEARVKTPPKPTGQGLKLAKQIGKGVLRGGAAAGLAADVATTPTDQILSRLVRQNPFTAGPAALAGFAARKFRGEGTVDALGSTFRDVVSPNSLGFVDPSGSDPLLSRAPRQSLFDRALGATGLGPTQADLDTFGAEDAAATAAQATGEGLPTPTQLSSLRDAGAELEPGRGVTAGGAPGARFGAEGERQFTQPDFFAAQAGIDPASRRGLASVEENQGVIGRLIERNRGIRAQGIRAAAQAQPGTGGQAQAAPAATQLAGQAQGGGIASAFGSLALSSNQLRREAADRTRAAAGQISERELQNKRDVAVIGQAGELARASATRDQNFSDNLNRLATTFGDITRDGTRDERNAFLDSTFLVASNNPGGPEAAFALPMLGAEIRDLAGKGFLTSFKPSTERGIFDWLASFGQGGQAEPLLTPAGQVTINVQTGMIEIVSPDDGTRQPLIDISKLPARHQELLRSQAVFVNKQVLADEPGDPTLRGRQAVTLSDAAQ